MGSGGTGAGGSNSGPIGSSGPRAGLGSPGAQGQVGNYSGTPGGGGGSGVSYGGQIGGSYGSAPPGYHAVYYQGTGGQMIAGYAPNIGSRTQYPNYGGTPAPTNIGAPRNPVGSNTGGTSRF